MSETKSTRKRAPTKTLPSTEYLRECFSYDPETGVLTWKERPRDHFKTEVRWRTWNMRYAGKAAGTVNMGYRHVAIGHIKYLTHRVIHKLMTGDDPLDTIDHKDGDGIDNRWKSLRPATRSQNQWNRRMHKTNTIGHRGVKRNRDKWQAYIQFNNVRHHLGTFDTIDDAAAAYDQAARELHGEFYRP